ncbi:hypothetical protein TVAG_476940 [Trichomonas vaginalis G3]|uniref:Uncharacterized protein n=1 Tax=Trichomonas vaginalis (strain ATCC PRA-98 / G3) TaxID=412133 RepID=A2DAB7_TRIV3|nr:hypothetical protein TVAGG3_0267070 [Trichomonas vaginalis G3]EAY22765.1 hypothetical protein TVAG_476940 [Trichomonas vaginalis G3]KAI5525576.1 hypothetical protein TVAGG3_0267070 [Trichomonas vaginalis G3]|eukprot:XP_001583751.1 hypothetical protein [Trichomonas vaginalis G3]
MSRGNLYQAKTYAYKEFISTYLPYIDRVFACDLSDSLFQSDPFKNFMHQDAVFCYTENITSAQEGETDFFSNYLGGQYWLPNTTLIVTPGVYMGSPIEIIKLMDLIQTFWSLTPDTHYMTDQPPTTMIFYKKFYADHNINFKTFNWCEGCSSVNVNFITNATFGNISILGCTKHPFYIHHYNYRPDILRSFYFQCPPKKYLSNQDYLMGLSNDDLNDLFDEVMKRKKSKKK